MTEAEWITSWVRAFVLTLVIETPCAAALLSPSGASMLRRVGVAAAAQFVTHPILWFAIPALHLARLPYLGVAELWAWSAEALFYRLVFPALPASRAALASAVSNATSLALGLTLRSLFGIV